MLDTDSGREESAGPESVSNIVTRIPEFFFFRCGHETLGGGEFTGVAIEA